MVPWNASNVDYDILHHMEPAASTPASQCTPPARTELVRAKDAVREGDAWGRVFAGKNQIAQAAEEQRQKLATERRLDLSRSLEQQMREAADKRAVEAENKKQAASELAASHAAWQLDQADKSLSLHKAMHQLKADVAAQMQQRQAARLQQAAAARSEVMQEAGRSNYDLLQQLDAEEDAKHRARTDLQDFLAGNDDRLREKRERQAQEREQDRHFVELYSQRLDKMDKERQAQRQHVLAVQQHHETHDMALGPLKKDLDPADMAAAERKRNDMLAAREEQALAKREQDKEEYRLGLQRQLADRAAQAAAAAAALQEYRAEQRAQQEERQREDAAAKQAAEAKKRELRDMLLTQREAAAASKVSQPMSLTEERMNNKLLSHLSSLGHL